MTLRASTIYADAWAVWRRDWRVLTAVAGMFVFLPQLALLLLVPDLPDVSTVTGTDPNDPTMRAYTVALQAWVGNYGLLYLSVVVAALYGQFALVAMYLTPARATVGNALGTALRLLPRLLLASAVWTLPLGLLGVILMRVPFLILPVFALVLARTLLVGPAIMAARADRRGRRDRAELHADARQHAAARQRRAQRHARAISGRDAVRGARSMDGEERAQPDRASDRRRCRRRIAALGATAMALVQVAAWRRLAKVSSAHADRRHQPAPPPGRPIRIFLGGRWRSGLVPLGSS